MKRKSFKHLTRDDRLKIEVYKKLGYSAKKIAEELGFSVRTIYYELKRGVYDWLDGQTWKSEKRYSPDIAHERYRRNLQAKGAALKIGNDHELAQYIENRIVKDGLSPLAVIGEIKRKRLPFKTSICVRTLYSYIEKGVFLNLDLKHLPVRGKRVKRKRKVKEASQPQRGVSIEKRPGEVAARTIFGHWEMDCVCGKTKAVLLVLTERLTRYEIIMPMKRQTAKNVVLCLNELEKQYGELFCKIFKSITVDNGVEFSDVQGLEQSIYGGKRTSLFYCHAYRPCERGTNERLNREIRRKVPKGTDLRNITRDEIFLLENWINNYPRQIFDFATSAEVFYKFVKSAIYS